MLVGVFLTRKAMLFLHRKKRGAWSTGRYFVPPRRIIWTLKKGTAWLFRGGEVSGTLKIGMANDSVFSADSPLGGGFVGQAG